jgi:TrmH family RNA methyltransferase
MSDDAGVDFRQLEIAPTLAKINKLQYDRRYRDSTRLFFAEGVRNFVEAVTYSCSIDVLLYSERLLTSTIARKIVRRLKRAGVAFARASPEQFREVSRTERASGIAAIYRQNILKIDQIKLPEQPFWTALSSIRSPGNFGTLARTSAAIGAAGFILIGDCIDPFDPNVVRATMGAIFKQKFARANAVELRAWIAKHNLQVIGASPDGQIDYDRISYKPPTILMLGNERSGLSPEQQLICQQIARIPMKGGTDSLNVAVAGSLLLYEMFRSAQRQL